nr:PREDICTED: uncharacterized protein LOC102358527 [Latimeria chalumnae]|eukprot:XP_014349862.1 PREDICTED: uncharacterized protein LOC102358527 [Latimeria chalumnae]
MLNKNMQRQLLMDGHYERIAFICTKTDSHNISEISRALKLRQKIRPQEVEIEKLEKQLKQLKQAATDKEKSYLERQIQEKRRDIALTCVKARNTYCKQQIQRDFTNGIKEMKRKAAAIQHDGDKEDPDDDDEDEEDISDEEEVSPFSEPRGNGNNDPNQDGALQVFTVSSTEFLKLKGKLSRDGPPVVFNTEEDTVFISVYAPTLDAEDSEKEMFYASLNRVLAAVPNKDKIILLGDFNARVSKDINLWSGVIEKEGVACAETVGYTSKKHQDWFDDNDSQIQELIDRKCAAFVDWQNNPQSLAKKELYHQLRAKTQHKICMMKNQWWIDKAKEIQGYADSHDSRSFFNAIKAIYGPTSNGAVPLQSSDGTILIKDNKDILQRWKEHFHKLLNQDVGFDSLTIDEIPQCPLITELDESPTLTEVLKAINQMENNKATGPDRIPSKVYKYGGPLLTRHLHLLLESIWAQEEVPQDLKDAIIVTIFKKKDDKSDCGNYHGIICSPLQAKSCPEFF